MFPLNRCAGGQIKRLANHDFGPPEGTLQGLAKVHKGSTSEVGDKVSAGSAILPIQNVNTR